jgi:hypothetical protein
MRTGKVEITHSYIVDLDTPDMVQEAKDALYEDVMSAVKFDELHAMIDVNEAPDADPGEIAEFLQEEPEDMDVD